MNDFNDLKEKYCQHLTVIRYAPGTIKRHGYFLDDSLLILRSGESMKSRKLQERYQDYQTRLYETKHRGEPPTAFSPEQQPESREGLLPHGDPHERSRQTFHTRVHQETAPAPKSRRSFMPPTRRQRHANRAIIEVFYSAGIRRNELINLQLADVDYYEGEPE